MFLEDEIWAVMFNEEADEALSRLEAAYFEPESFDLTHTGW